MNIFSYELRPARMRPLGLFDCNWQLKGIGWPRIVIRKPEVVFDPGNFPQLCSAVAVLCAHLEWELAHFEGGSVGFNELLDTYNSVYQPQAVALLNALLNHVPSDDPRITITLQTGTRRVLTSDDVNMAHEPLHEEVAAEHLRMLACSLRELVAYLPPEV